jgi:hypothetical protein
MVAITVVGRSTGFGQVALAVASNDGSLGHARLNAAPLAELACATGLDPMVGKS